MMLKPCTRNKILKISAITLATMAMTQVAIAHSVWLVPSHTLLSGDKPTSVTVDSSVSNDIFHPDMAFGGKAKQDVGSRLARMNKSHTLTLVEPDKHLTELEIVNFGRKSVAQVPLAKSGTYKITMRGEPRTIITYTDSKGEQARAMSDAELPTDATDVNYLLLTGNVLSYITYNDTKPIAELNSGSGLELAGNTHPNDLFVGEAAHFQLLFDGQAAADTEVKLTQAGTRWRNNRNEIELTTDNQGEFTFTPKAAGMYLLEASKSEKLDTTHTKRSSISVSLEVMPE